MDFAHYSNEAANFAAELVNTKGSVSGNEYVDGVDAWKEFLGQYLVKDLDALTEDDIASIRRYRERLREVWFADETGAVDLLNDMLREVSSTPQVSNHDGQPWHMHYSAPDSSIAHRVAAGA